MARALAISMGDPAGIGPEVIAKAWALRMAEALPPFFVVGDARAVEAVSASPVARITDPSEALDAFPHALPVLHIDGHDRVSPGKPDIGGAQVAFQSLEMATGLARSDGAAALVTGPVSKAQLQKVGFTQPGQTEFVAERCGVARQNAVMMLAGPELRVVPITVHTSLASVPGLLTIDLIRTRALVTAKGLQRNFGIANPRLAMAGLNPHAGEQGRFGDEERTIIQPAIDSLRAEGLDITGPLPADSLFHAAARERYDAVLCQYHDQALIPFKTLHFEDGVNMTLGLPIVRTSPDHGTAFDIAGQDVALPTSMIAAIRMADSALMHRQQSGPQPA